MLMTIVSFLMLYLFFGVMVATFTKFWEDIFVWPLMAIRHIQKRVTDLWRKK